MVHRNDNRVLPFHLPSGSIFNSVHPLIIEVTGRALFCTAYCPLYLCRWTFLQTFSSSISIFLINLHNVWTCRVNIRTIVENMYMWYFLPILLPRVIVVEVASVVTFMWCGTFWCVFNDRWSLSAIQPILPKRQSLGLSQHNLLTELLSVRHTCDTTTTHSALWCTLGWPRHTEKQSFWSGWTTFTIWSCDPLASGQFASCGSGTMYSLPNKHFVRVGM